MKYPSNSLFVQPKNSRFTTTFRIIAVIVVSVIIFLAVSIHFAISPPLSFKSNSFFAIHEGQTVDEIADSLKTGGYIRSSFALKLIFHGGFLRSDSAVAGEYLFERPMSAFLLAQRINTGNFNQKQIKITLPEGLDKFDTAEIFENSIPEFDKEKFLSIAEEGYLFPDTYFFYPSTSPEKIVETLHENFDEQIRPYILQIGNSGRSLEDIVKMASIVETEARQFETRQIVAGILWNRLDQGMPLQVDVSFKYINGKTTADLTVDDLALDSPYNSYKYAGLPPTPISNPGLDSILATISPQETDYLYFLTGDDGVMYYAENFDDHKKNRELYFN